MKVPLHDLHPDLHLGRPHQSLISSYIEALREGMKPARHATAAEEIAALSEDIDKIWPAFAHQVVNGQDDGNSCLEDMFWISKDEAFLGYISLKTDLRGLQALYGGHIGRELRPSARGKGYGTWALQHIKLYAMGEGLSAIDFVTAHDNMAAIASIKKCGGYWIEDIPQPDIQFFNSPAVRYRIDLE
jgi:predicted acetyltransferase